MAAATLGDVAVRVRADTSGLKSDISDGTNKAMTGVEPDVKKAGERSGSRFGAAFTKAAKIGIAGVAAAGAAAGVVIVKALRGGFKRLKDIDTAKAKLRGLGFEGKRLEKVMTAAANSVDGTAFGLDAAATAAGTLAAAGVKITDMEGTLKNVANLASVIGSDMQYAAGIFGEVAAQGKITGNVLTQMEQAGFGATAALAEGLGKTRVQIKEMAKDGQITAEMFNKAMKDKLGTAALEVGKSWEGVMANIRTRVNKLGAQVLEPMFERLKPILTRFNEWLNTQLKAGWGSDLGNTLATGFDTIVAAFQGKEVRVPFSLIPPASLKDLLPKGTPPAGIAAPTPTVTPFAPGTKPPATSALQGATGEKQPLQTALNGIQPAESALSKFGGFLKNTFAQLSSSIKPLKSAWDELKVAFQDALPWLKPLGAMLLKVFGSAVVGMIKGIIKVITGLLKILTGLYNVITGLFSGDMSKVWEGLKQIVTGALTGIIGIIQFFWNFGIAAAFKKGFSAIFGIFKLAWTGLRALAVGLWGAIKGVFINALRGIVGTVKAFFTSIPVYFRVLRSQGMSILKAAWETIKTVFTTALKGIGSGVKSFFTSIPKVFKSGMTALWNAVKAGWTKVKEVFTKGWAEIKKFFSDLPAALGKIGKGIINGLVGGIQGAAGLVKKAVQWIADHIPQWAKDILHIGSPSKVMAEQIGRWIPAGLAAGIDSGIGALRKSVRAMANDVTMTAVNGVPRAPGTSQRQPQTASRVNNNTDSRSTSVVLNHYGSQSLSDLRREIDWQLRFAPQRGPSTLPRSN